MKQKNLFLTFIAFMCLNSQVLAQTIEVKSLSQFSTANPPATISVEILDPLILNDKALEAGTVLDGKLVNVVSPKRLKRNASFSFEPTSYKDNTGKHSMFDEKINAQYTTTLDKKQLAKSAVVGVGGIFVKGLKMQVAAVEGAVKNKEGNVLKSSAVSVYEASPVSYVKKGQDLNIKTNDVFYLKFPDADKKEMKNKTGGENYTYSIEKE